jgi:hypothetical protein
VPIHASWITIVRLEARSSALINHVRQRLRRNWQRSDVMLRAADQRRQDSAGVACGRGRNRGRPGRAGRRWLRPHSAIQRQRGRAAPQ